MFFLPIVVKPLFSGNVIDDNLEFSKASLPIEKIKIFNYNIKIIFTVCNQSYKKNLPIEVTLFGIVIDVNGVPSKQLLPIDKIKIFNFNYIYLIKYRHFVNILSN